MIPWFVAWYDGKPDFRVVDVAKMKRALTEHLCWICGEKITDVFVFVMPRGATVSREPACHRNCAEMALLECPFISNPDANYRKPRDGAVPLGGERKHPGGYDLYATREYRPFRAADGGLAIELGERI